MTPTPKSPADPESRADVSVEGEPAAHAEENLHGEVTLGGTPRGLAANAVLLALSRAARSFLIYEPSNEAIRAFLQNLKTSAENYLNAYGELDLGVRPFEIVHGSEVVYLDRDRERSLAFRLYRDGIRKLTLRPGLEWSELLKLLEVVSIRYVGIRQTEDDLVVLLWKAGFHHIAFEAVEGFVADTEGGGEAQEDSEFGSQGTGPAITAPPDFDLPLPSRPNMVRVTWREVPAPALAELLHEDDSQAVPELAVRSCEELLKVLDDPTDPMRFADLLPHLSETREFLFAEGLIGHTVRLAYAAASATLRDPVSDALCGEFLAGFVSTHALERFLHSVSRDASEAPPELHALLGALPGDHLSSLLEVLGRQTGEASRRVTRRLIERYVAERGDEIVKFVETANPGLACELLRVLRYSDLDRAMAATRLLIEVADVEVQLELLRTLEVLPMSTEVARLLLRLATTDNEEVRIRALGLLAARQASAAYPQLLARLKSTAAARLTDNECERLGETLVAIAPDESLAQFREWCKPKGFFGSVTPGLGRLQRAAVAGLVHLRGEEAEALVRAVAEQAGSDLSTYCTQAMIRRRRLMRGEAR
jgi:hypothetical protein